MIYLKKIEGCKAQKLLAVRKSHISNFNDPARKREKSNSRGKKKKRKVFPNFFISTFKSVCIVQKLLHQWILEEFVYILTPS